MKFDNFNAVDNGFANVSGGTLITGGPISNIIPNVFGTTTSPSTSSNYQVVENYVDVYSFDVAPPSNIGLPSIVNMPTPNAYGLSTVIPDYFLKLVVRMERGLSATQQNPNNFILAKSLWFSQIRPSVIAFMRNAKTPTAVNILNNKFAQVNAQFPLMPENFRGYRFTYSLAYMTLNITNL